MANYNETLVYNSITLDVETLTPMRKQKTRKVVLGKSLSQVNIIGLNAQQWELAVSGVVIGATLTELGTKRAQIEAFDDVTVHAYVDGLHDGNYYLKPGTLRFNDSGKRGNLSYVYKFTLIEE